MLWHSRELEPARDRAVCAHLETCSHCQQQVAELDHLFGLAGRVSGLLASGRRLQEIQRVHRFRKHKITAAIALAVAASVAFVFFLIPDSDVARADAILQRAAESERQPDSTLPVVRIASHNVTCPAVAMDAAIAASYSVEEPPSLCRTLIHRLHHAGWLENPLSARGYRQWREGLSSRNDVVSESGQTVAITTEAPQSPLRLAQLELSVPAYRVLTATFHFVADNGADTEVLRVVSADQETSPVLAGVSPIPAEPIPPGLATLDQAPAGPVFRPADEAELQVRLALHQLQLDQDVLVDVESGADAVRVWGVVESPGARETLARELAGLTAVRVEIGSAKASSATPWETFQGDREPLAFDRLNELYPSNAAMRDGFVNAATGASRCLAGIARMREGAARLAQRLQGHSGQSELQRVIAELDAEAFLQKQQIAQGIATLTAPISVSDRPLSAAEGEQLYLLVHELVFMRRPTSTESYTVAIQRISSLLDTP